MTDKQVFKILRAQSRGGGLPLVEVDINGIKARMVIDTGSDICSLSPRLVAQLGLLGDVKPFGQAAGIAAHPVEMLGVDKPVTIMGKEIKCWLVFTGLATFGEGGLLGMDVLRQFKTVTFDNANQTLTVEG